jgi:hypothetical protein
MAAAILVMATSAAASPADPFKHRTFDITSPMKPPTSARESDYDKGIRDVVIRTDKLFAKPPSISTSSHLTSNGLATDDAPPPPVPVLRIKTQKGNNFSPFFRGYNRRGPSTVSPIARYIE